MNHREKVRNSIQYFQDRHGKPIQQTVLIIALLVSLAAGMVRIQSVQAAQSFQPLYYLAVPEDDALQNFRDSGGTIAVSPIRSVTSIAIGTTGTVIYFDHWEDGYAGNILPDADLVWGDSNLANGCPPNISNTPNPCLVAADDALQSGEIVVLDNQVVVNGTPGSYSRNPAQVFYDGRDKFQATYPVAVSRALWPTGPGSLQAGGVEMVEYGLWGDYYEFPFSQATGYTGLFENVTYLVIAGPQGSVIDVDVNGDGDLLDAGDLDNYAMAEGAKFTVNSPVAGGTISVVDGSNVQVTVAYSDIQDTYEMRWSALLTRRDWSNDYISPVGTQDKGGDAGSTRVWVYNPNAANITVNYTIGNGGGSSTFTVNAGSVGYSPEIGYNQAIRLYTSNADQVFLPFTVTDTDDGLPGNQGQIYDWDSSLFPTSQLSSQFLIGWAPGCTNESHLGACQDADGSPNFANSVSRSVIWVTSLTATTIYVDTDGSGITCEPTVVGAEQTINAQPLYSYRINNDPERNNVRDEFSTAAYTNNNGSENWSTNWTETGDDNNPANGTIRITGGQLRFGLNGTGESGDYIARSRDLTGYLSASLTFSLSETQVDDTGDSLVVEVLDSGGAWIVLGTFNNGDGGNKVYDISQYISANTAIRFRLLDNLENDEYWYVDNVDIQYSAMANVRDQFDIQAYTNNNGSQNWTTNWSETSDDGSAGGTGSIRINGGYLEMRDSGSEAGDTIYRSHNLSGTTWARLSFQIQGTSTEAGDAIVAEVSPDGGTTWNQLEQYDGTISALQTIVYNISPYISSNTTVRFRFIDDLEAGDLWQIDNVNIQYAVGGDYDMTGAVLRTCDGTTFSTAYGQDPALSQSGDNEALDLGTIVVPYASVIDVSLDKQINDDTPAVGDTVTFTLAVSNAGPSVASSVYVKDHVPSGYTYVAGTMTGGSSRDETSPTGTGLVWRIDSLAVGASVNLTYQATVNASGEYDNYAQITSHVQLDVDSIPGDYSTTEDDDDLVTVLVSGTNAAIGDRIWLDEDGDGRQDAGEAGIPNVTVELRYIGCTAGLDCPTRVTDSEGNYMFAGLTSGSYTVAVISGLPGGLSANPTYDEDGIGSPNTTAVTVSGGDEHVTADFGYNWATTTDVTNPGGGATGAIGDRIWNDADGDGIQDTGEAGIAGVTVTLVTAGADGILGTTDDGTTATTTNAAGNYVFDNLAAGGYKIVVTPPPGYTQKGDPDQLGATCTTCDNQTSTPIILAPGDVFLNADFGYQLNSGANTIGNQIFVDANGDGNLDIGEPGIPGVTVALLDNSGNVIATTVTDVNGQYSFPGLPNGTYTVWVNDTANVFGTTLVQNSTPNNAADGGQPCGTCNGRNTVTVSGSGNAFQDFGYAPPGHGSGDRLIGDTIFLDRDGGNDYDAGEGLEGVIVRLYRDNNNDGNYDAGETLLQTTTTDENGNYYFGNLAVAYNNFVVMVEPSSMPPGLTNTVDPDTTNSPLNESGINVPAGGINLLQDFGYRDTSSPNAISGTLWTDTDADGFLDGSESARFNNVTMVLYDTYGDIVATTTTNASGNYSFPNLPDGTYRVDVVDSNNILNGYWHSTGPNPGVNNNSQSDPYTVSVSGGQSNTTADFGYYVNPSAVSDYVWLDLDNDGIQDANEPGISGVTVTLTSTYTNGTVSTVSILTDAGGLYNFGNLLLDENHDGTGSGEPTYSLTFTTPSGSSPSPTGAGTPSTDSNGINPTVSPLYEGQSDTTYDSGFYTTLLDLGDLPTTAQGFTYPTLFQPGPAHLVFPDGNSDNKPETAGGIPAVWLGSVVDVESNGQPDVDAFGDDTSGTADEDGLSLASTGWIAGQSSTATVTLNASESAVRVYYGFWIDWDNNGSLETFYSGSGVTGSPVSVNVTVAVPAGYIADTRVYMRVRASSTPFSITDYQGTRVNGEVEDHWYKFDSGGTPTPVTLSYFKSERQGDQVLFTWTTATETGNVGFNLYGKQGGSLVLLNDELIGSNAIDSLTRQDYAFTAQSDAEVFYIEDVDVYGDTRRHGPFTLGEEYGSLDEMEPIDWQAVEGDLESNRILQPEFAKGTGQVNALNMKVSQTGLYRVTYENLRNAGLDLNGVRPASIKVTLGGKAVPIYVLTTEGRFGPGNYIEFHGKALDTLYTDTNVYTIQLSQTRSPLIAVDNTALTRGARAVTSYLETVLVNNQRAYANYAPGMDAWYDTSMLVYKIPKTWDFQFDVNGLANPSTPATLKLVVWGVTDWPQSPDHHLLASVNGNPVADVMFNGLTEQVITVSLPGGTLKEGANTLQLTLPGDTGVKYDMVNLDRFSVTYKRLFNAKDGRLTFTASGNAFRVKNLPSPNVVVYRLEKNRPVRIGKVTVKASGDTYMATFPGSKAKYTYLVSTVDSLYAPVISKVPVQVNLDKRAEYLIISHPAFIDGIQPLVQARKAQGLTVNVVDVNALYAKYTYGVFDPKAIKNYIAYAAQNLGTQYVLLVGGDTYDYRNYLGKNSISFIPSLYVTTSNVAKFVPADPLYADYTGDNVPDLAIGRFPVRTAAELELMVNKTLAYQNKDYGRTAVFAADKVDRGLSFKSMSLIMSGSLPSSWSVENIHLDNLSVTSAQAQLVAAMNRGVSLVTFTGHSGPTAWTFSGLFGMKNAAALTNTGRPFVVMQWGCWNTYYVDPVNNYLVQSFLFSGDRGAAAVLGASTLTDSYSEELLGRLLIPRMVTPGMNMGQALLDAKQELALAHPDLLDVLLGWTLMGDPALVVEP